MDLQWRNEDSEARFGAYVWALSRVMGHADRVEPFRSYCTGLILPGARKSVEPMAARLEQAYGGLGAATKRRLADLAKTMERDGDLVRSRVARLKPGAKLIREWRGETHTVIGKKFIASFGGPVLPS